MRKSILTSIFIFTILIGHAQTNSAQNYIHTLPGISPDSFMEFKIEENKYSFGYLGSPLSGIPCMFNDSIKLSSIDSSIVIWKDNIFYQKAYKILVEPSNILLDTIAGKITMDGIITGGWYGAGSEVQIFIGERIDTIFPQTFILGNPNLAEEYYKERKRQNLPDFEYLNIAFYLRDFSGFESEAGFESSKERAFKLSARINNKSILVFGLTHGYAEIFDIGKMLKLAKQRPL